MNKLCNWKPEDDFRGVVYRQSGENVVINSVTGFADLANEVQNTVKTRFASASAGKVFVAIAVLKLIEEGRLRLDNTLGDVLDIDLHDIDPTVTVEELLTHTSGVPDYFDESVMDEYEELWVDFPNYRIRHNADLLPLFIEKPMMYPRGERFQYNNTGFVLLAMMLEKVTGMEFDEYIKQVVFEPAGMDDCGYFELDRLPARCANNYIYNEESEEYRTNIFAVDAKGTGAGGAYITVEDIVKLWRALVGCKLLSKELTDAMLSVHSGDEDDGYGYGIWISEMSDGKLVPYFQGCDPGVSFISDYDASMDAINVLVSNYGDDVWDELGSIWKAVRAEERGVEGAEISTK